MPRVQMTRMVRISLGVLLVYLVGMLSLIGYKAVTTITQKKMAVPPQPTTLPAPKPPTSAPGK